MLSQYSFTPVYLEDIDTMDERGSWEGVPTLFERVARIIEQRSRTISVISTVAAFLIAVLDAVFGVNLTPVGDTIAAVTTSQSFVSSLLIFILVSHILLHQRIEQLSERIESVSDTDQPDQSVAPQEAESEEVVTDGGDSDLQSRDSSEKFTSRSAGGGTSYIILLTATGIGALLLGQNFDLNPLVGFLIGISVFSLLWSRR